MSNVLKQASVLADQPYLLPAHIVDGAVSQAEFAQNEAERMQRAVLLWREQEARAHVQDIYIQTKAQTLLAGEEAGRAQGAQECRARMEKLCTEHQARLREAKRRQEEDLHAADESVREEAETFAFALAEKIFGYPVDRADPVFSDLWGAASDESYRTHDGDDADGEAPNASADESITDTAPVRQVPVVPDISGEAPPVDQEVVRQAEQLLGLSGAGEQDDAAPQDLLDIAVLPARPLQKLLKNVPVKDLAVALKGLRAEGREALLDALPKHLRETARQEMEFLGPVPPDETARAQKRIFRTFDRLQRAGELNL